MADQITELTRRNIIQEELSELSRKATLNLQNEAKRIRQIQKASKVPIS